MTHVMGVGFPTPINGPIECGVRALIVLNAHFPRRLDMASLALHDYFVVHTADLGGPESIHPALASRPGEYRARRQLVADGLALMRRMHLVEVVDGSTGRLYVAADDAPAFVDLLSTSYNERLKSCADWLARLTNVVVADAFEYIGKGALEFEHDVCVDLGLPDEKEGRAVSATEIDAMLGRFSELMRVYESDLERLAAWDENAFLLQCFSDQPCPLCGAEARHRHLHLNTADIDAQRKAAVVEMSRIRRDRDDLRATVASLEAEARELWTARRING